MIRHITLGTGMAIVLCAVGGCGGATDPAKANRPQTVPATGVVTYQGKPLDGATVVLAPKNSEGTAASAVSDASGRFALQAFPPDPGAVPGDYTAVVTKTETPATAAPAAAHDDAGAGQAAKSLIPEKYGDASTSGLDVNIPEGGRTDIRIDLKD